MQNFLNMQKMIDLSYPSWLKAKDSGLARIKAAYDDTGLLVDRNDHRFINMCSCSYLGLDRNEKILQGAMDAVREFNALTLSTPRTRIGISLIDEVEARLSAVFQCETIVTISCAAASAGILPLLASGYFTSRQRPLMIFDKQAHFSLNYIKPNCGDETEVITCPHNDVAFIEERCRNADRPVVYVADGAYSMGGQAPLEKLMALQQKYGLYLFYDDSHSVSAYGRSGMGVVRDLYGELHERTIVVSSLGKAFGAMGGVVMLGNPALKDMIEICGGPLYWSQTVSTPCLGAIRAAAEIHLGSEIADLQAALGRNIALFDSMIRTSCAGNRLPIRVIPMGSPELAISASQRLFQEGFYSSALYFPIVPKGESGLRVMLRADMDRPMLEKFCRLALALADGDASVKNDADIEPVQCH